MIYLYLQHTLGRSVLLASLYKFFLKSIISKATVYSVQSREIASQIIKPCSLKHQLRFALIAQKLELNNTFIIHSATQARGHPNK